MRRAAGALLLLALAGGPPLPAQQCAPGPVALVLSGGGARGYAHLGVLRVLDSLGLRPDLIVGTSMGAIMGAMYASGHSAAGIDSIVAGLAFDDLFRRPGPQVPRAFGPLRPLVMWEQSDRGYVLQNLAVREAEANAILAAALLRGNLLARGDFDRLPIRFRAVATDLNSRDTVVLHGGDLAQSVRASIAIPLVFSPVRVNGRALIDGGLSANVPVAIARRLQPGRVIVSDVTEGLADSVAAENALAVADQLMNFLFTQPRDSLGPSDVYVRPDVLRFRALDFRRESLAGIEAAGRAAAEAALGQAPCFAPAPPAPAPSVPGRIGEVVVLGGTPADQALLRRALDLVPGAVELRRLERRLLALGDGDPFKEVWLTPSGSGDTAHFAPRIVRAPRRLGGLGIAYDSDLSGRVWAGALDRRLLGLPVEGSGLVGIGRYRDDASLAFRHAAGGGGIVTLAIVAALAALAWSVLS